MKTKILTGIIIALLNTPVVANENIEFEDKNKHLGFIEPKLVSNVSSMVSGVVDEWFIDIGSIIDKNETMLTLNRDLSIASIETAKQELSFYESQMDAQKRLLNNNHISETDFQNSKLNYYLALDKLNEINDYNNNRNIKAPFKGSLVKKEFEVGEFVNSGDSIGTLYSSDDVKAYAYIFDFNKKCIEDCDIYIKTKSNVLYGPYKISYAINNLENSVYNTYEVGVYIKENLNVNETVDFFLINRLESR